MHVYVYGVEYRITKEKAMPRIEVYIPTKEEVKAIKRLAKENGLSVSELVREQLKAKAAKHG